MAQGSRPERIGEEIRQELSQALGTEVRDPGIGFVTLTRVKVSPDLQVARVYYTIIGDDKAKRETKKALDRATPYLRRHIAATVRLRRVPELFFHFDESVEKQDRIEQILIELQKEREAREAAQQSPDAAADTPSDDDKDRP
jgi:ribosome-binding factor A